MDVPTAKGNVRMATVISWEVFFGGRAREGVVDGAELLINPTNGASYTGTIVQTQQVASSRLRAIETGRWLVQAAPTGFTAIIDADGNVLQRTSVSEQRVLYATVPLRTGNTWYVTIGDGPFIWLLCIAFVGAWWMGRRPAAGGRGTGERRRVSERHDDGERSEELLDVIDVETGAVLDTLPRSEVHARGLWHDVFHCLVVRPSARSVVLQRRAMSKAAFPGRVDLSVTGHLSAGETPRDGVREADEELGVPMDAAQLVPIGVHLMTAGPSARSEGTDRERAHAFLLADDRPIDSYRPPPEEITALIEIGIDDLLAIIADPHACVTVDEWSGGRMPTSIPLSRDDLVHSDSDYWGEIATAAARFLGDSGSQQP